MIAILKKGIRLIFVANQKGWAVTIRQWWQTFSTLNLKRIPGDKCLLSLFREN